MGWIPRVMCLVCLAACGPRVEIPSEDEGGGSATTERPPPSDTTTGSVPPSVTIGTSPMPVTTGSVDSTTYFDDGWYPDWGLPGATTEACDPWAFEGCGESPRTNAFVAGTTPLGEFDVAFSAFASNAGCSSCVDAPNVDRLFFVSTPADLSEFEPPEVGLVLTVWVYEGPVGTTTGGSITAYRDGTIETDAATVEFDTLPAATDLAEPFDPSAPAYVNGSFTAESWDLSGTFAAVYCPKLNIYAICE